MIDKKIIYKDPMESEISAIIDLSDKPPSNLATKQSNYLSRDIQQIEQAAASATAKKIASVSASYRFCNI